MPPRSRTIARLLAAAAAGLTLVACQVMPGRTATVPPIVVTDTVGTDPDLAAAMFMADTFRSMQRLAQAAPAEQAEILSAARDAFQRHPRGNAQLRYALLLAAPNHLGRNAILARILLRELVAEPNTLAPLERAVVMVELSQLGRELDLQTDNEHLQAAALRTDQQRSAATQRQIEAEAIENARLRKQLQTAQSKLDAIASIERNLTDRATGTEADVATRAAPARTTPASRSSAGADSTARRAAAPANGPTTAAGTRGGRATHASPAGGHATTRATAPGKDAGSSSNGTTDGTVTTQPPSE